MLWCNMYKDSLNICPNCGRIIAKGSACKNCGYKQPETNDNSGDNNGTC